MCCAKCNCGAPGCSAPQQVEFYTSLLDGMHALAQPITVLRSHLYLAQTSAACGAQAQPLLSDATTAVEHLCTLFRLMQELVLVQSVEARRSATPLSCVLGLLAEDAEVVFAGTGVRLDLRSDLESAPSLREYESAALLAVNVDSKRTRQAIASLLHVARACAHPHSVVSCHVSTADCWVKLSIRPEQTAHSTPEDTFDEGVRLHLALAKASIAGQQGVFCQDTEPFAFSVQLPIASAAA